MELQLNSCTIRSWRLSDAPSLLRHAHNRKIWRNLREGFPHPYTAGDASLWLKAATSQSTEIAFAIAVEGQAVGGIGVEPQKDVYHRSAEIGFWLGEQYWGRGIATEAVRAFTEYVFDTFDVCRIFARVFEWNPASGRVLEKCGYTLEGRLRKSVTKDGRTIDEMIYGIVSRSASSAPSGR
jgi:RimJ/RimL family protein N-acetyltransferase